VFFRVSQLPVTGADVVPLLLAGTALLAGGLLLRRRTKGDDQC
jgi:LPXTG-motif cell wall-anchored protein